MNRKFSMYNGMISGQDEQAVRTYKKIESKNTIWYIAIQENPADNVYCTAKVKSGRSNGFGGASLEFHLEDGTVDIVQGPWHSNSHSLLKDTGYDITKTCLTQGICAKEVTGSILDGYEYIDVLHYDEVPTIGQYDRIMTIAQNLANEHKCRIYYAMKSSGGANSYFRDPQN